MAREKRSIMAPHTYCQMVVVIGNWHDSDPIVLGAVEDSTYEAYVEEDRWEAVKQEMWDASGQDDVPNDTLREVRVDAYIPFLWDIPRVEGPHHAKVTPEERLGAAVAALKRREEEVKPQAEEGLPNAIAQAQGRLDGLAEARNLLEMEDRAS